MKLTKFKLKQLIKEELEGMLAEAIINDPRRPTQDVYDQRFADPSWQRTGDYEEDPNRPGEMRSILQRQESAPQMALEEFSHRKCEEWAAKYFPDRDGDPSSAGLRSDWPPEKTEFFEKCREIHLDPNYQGPNDANYKLLRWAERENLRGFVDVDIPAWQREERGQF